MLTVGLSAVLADLNDAGAHRHWGVAQGRPGQLCQGGAMKVALAQKLTGIDRSNQVNCLTRHPRRARC